MSVKQSEWGQLEETCRETTVPETLTPRARNVTAGEQGVADPSGKMAEQQADELMAKAEKKLKGRAGDAGGMFGSLFGSKKEDAIELFQEAANKYKQAKRWSSCGDAHRKSAELQLAINDKFGAASRCKPTFPHGVVSMSSRLPFNLLLAFPCISNRLCCPLDFSPPPSSRLLLGCYNYFALQLVPLLSQPESHEACETTFTVLAAFKQLSKRTRKTLVHPQLRWNACMLPLPVVCKRLIEDFRNQAIDLHINNGRFSQAAKFHKEAGELFESDLNYPKAIEHFQVKLHSPHPHVFLFALLHFASSPPSLPFAPSPASSPPPATTLGVNLDPRCGVDVCNGRSQQAEISLLAEQEQYSRAIEVFESVASSSLDVALLKWSVKDYFFQAGLCHLATGDIIAFKRAEKGGEEKGGGEGDGGGRENRTRESARAVSAQERGREGGGEGKPLGLFLVVSVSSMTQPVRYQDLDVSFSDTRECKLWVESIPASPLLLALSLPSPHEFTSQITRSWGSIRGAGFNSDDDVDDDDDNENDDDDDDDDDDDNDDDVIVTMILMLERLIEMQISKLDKWKTSLLLKVKNQLKDSDLT
eukprot:754079-Hanusia_phi.AAC.2